MGMSALEAPDISLRVVSSIPKKSATAVLRPPVFSPSAEKVSAGRSASCFQTVASTRHRTRLDARKHPSTLAGVALTRASMRRLGVALLLAHGELARNAAARPAPRPHLELVYTDASGVAACPDEASLRALVAARLGYDPFRSGAAERLEVVVAWGKKGLRGEVRWVGSSQTAARGRVFEAPADDCAELGQTLALAMSIAIDPFEERSSPSQPSDPVDPAAIRDVGRANPGPPDERTQPTPYRIVPRLGAGAIVSMGLVPDGGPGGFVAIGADYGALSITGEGRFHASQTLHSGPGSIEISARSLLVVPCFRANWLSICGVVTRGTLHGSATGYDRIYQADSPLWETGLRLALSYPASNLVQLSAFAEGQMVLEGTSFNVDGASVWRVRPATFVVAGAFSFHFH
jgi:hypothetical protein